MNIRNTLQKLLLSALLSSVCLATVVSADDTEIFFGQSSNAFNTNPNILFVLDTSGSMGWYDTGFDGTRMDRLKIAMRVLLQESSSFNVGLMGFQGSNRGGSIRYPVGDLESDSTGLCPNGICPDERVVVKPSSSSDDATQNNDTSIVTLNADALSMAETDDTTVIATTQSAEVSGSAVAVAITAENEISGIGTDTRAITTANRWFYNGVEGAQDDRYAYRFENIDIPAGATVTSATLSFTPTNAAAQVGNLSALINLEVTTDPAPLPDGANGEATLAYRLATPGLTTTGVAWDNVPPDTTGATKTTPAAGSSIGVAVSPDLSDIVNTITSLQTWESGKALSFILDTVDEYEPSSQDMREFEGLNAPEARRPVLNFTYSEDIDTDKKKTESIAVAHLDEITKQVGDVVSRNLTNPSARTFFASAENFSRKLAFRFDNIDIPTNAVIETATLSLTGAEADSDSDETDWVVDPTTGTVVTTAAAPDTPDTPDTPTTPTQPTTTVDNILTLNISAEKTGKPATYDSGILASRELTDKFYAWNDFTIDPDEEKSATGLKEVIAAVINGDDWSAGDDLSLVLEAPDNYNNIEENSTLIQTATGASKPKLFITWKEGETETSTLLNTQTTALRFQNVHVPPGANIKTAKLVFKSAKASIGQVELEISADNVSASAPLTAEFNNIGARNLTGKRVNWEVEPWSAPNTDYNSPDITEVVKSITEMTDWCGGNPITILINKLSGVDSRHAVSFDQNQVSAPRLEITYSPDTVTSGAYCSNATLQSNISINNDDATQRMDTNAVDRNTVSLDTKHPTSDAEQVIGLRFRGINIPKGTAIIGAELELTHEKDVVNTQEYEVKMVSALETFWFNTQDGRRIVPTTAEDGAYRATYPNTTTASITPGPRDTSVFSVDVTSLVTDKITDDVWIAGKDMVLIVDALGDESHSFYSANGSDVYKPRLKIYYQSERDQAGTRFRDNLIEIVDSMVPQGGTPIVGAYYEAAQYFLGENVDYGLRRGNQGTDDRYHRVSHPGSYTNGIVNRQSGCADADLNADACIRETIERENGLTPTYLSPVESECQQNHIVLLSDGSATSNTAASKVRALTGDNACLGSGSEECGRELASWLHDNDIDGVLDGTQNVSTHTIGFNLENPDFLKDLASNGGGSFYEAASSAELVNAFKNIFINVSKTDTSFVAPSATVSQSNRLKNREDIYFSLFKPEGTARWAGNLKRYKLAGNSGETADILDVNNAPAVNSDTGRFFDTAQSFWSDVVDGDSVLLGGAAEKIETDGVSFESREVYTYTGKNLDLTAIENDLMPENTDLNRDWLKLPSSVVSDDDYIRDMLYWAHGKDVYDIDGDGDTEEARAQMGDPMHSQPLLVNYIGGKSVVHLATNEGFLHAIDHETGEENFAFMPKELLKNIRANYENEPTRNRAYGLDGGLTLWIDDANNDGIVDPSTDKAYLYIGMRRGGSLYYALDVTEPTAPKYMWSINGGSDTVLEECLPGEVCAPVDNTVAEGDYSNLGQTWSKPVKTKLYDDNNIVDVLIFGAGYGTNQDPTADIAPDLSDPTVDTRQTRQEDNVGLGFYIVNALTGEHIYDPDSDPDSDYDKLMYSVPSDLRVIDINFDGLVDQIYFGDMGGQVWRFDYNNDQAIDTSIPNRMNGGRIGIFAGDTPESARRFYYPPDVALLSIEGKQQLSISIGSGWRAHPLDDVVEDRFYNFRMTQVYGVPIREDGAVRYPNVYENEINTNLTELTDADVARTADASEKGWFLPLRPSEKVLSSSITLDGNVVFTSYLPSVNTGSCAAAVGSGSVYYLDAATGNPVSNLDVDPDAANSGTEDTSDLDAADRRRGIPNSGIPPGASLLFPEDGSNATGFAGKEKLKEVQIDPADLKQKTFWQEFVEESL